MTMARVPDRVLIAIDCGAEKNQKHMREVAEEYNERLELALKQTIEEGELIFGKAKPLQRLQGYMRATMLEDLLLVTDPNYLAFAQQGMLPAPLSPMWLTLYALPSYCFEYFARDFRQLLNEHPEEKAAVEEGIRIVIARAQMGQINGQIGGQVASAQIGQEAGQEQAGW